MLLHEIWDKFYNDYTESFLSLPRNWKSKCGQYEITVENIFKNGNNKHNTIINNKSVTIDTCQGVKMDIYQDNVMNYSLYVHTQKIYGVNYFHLVKYTESTAVHYYNNYHIVNIISWIKENFEPDPPF